MNLHRMLKVQYEAHEANPYLRDRDESSAHSLWEISQWSDP